MNKAAVHMSDASPLRIGDTFEDLKRKMIPLNSVLMSPNIESNLGRNTTTEVTTHEMIEDDMLMNITTTTTEGVQIEGNTPSKEGVITNNHSPADDLLTISTTPQFTTPGNNVLKYHL